MEVAVDTETPIPQAETAGPNAEHNIRGVPTTLYADAQEALRAVRDDYLYWTGKVTETSVQLSYAVLGANWAAFGSVNEIISNVWSKFSVFAIVLSLGVSVVGAQAMGEQHLKRINYAETD